MSYSFSVRAADKAAARTAIAAELDKVEAQQPVHAHDRDVAEGAAGEVLDLIPDPESDAEEVSVTVSGWVQWKGLLDQGHTITGANVNVSASIVAKPTAG